MPCYHLGKCQKQSGKPEVYDYYNGGILNNKTNYIFFANLVIHEQLVDSAQEDWRKSHTLLEKRGFTWNWNFPNIL